ncbi:hypothetical protein NBRC116592_01380 [Colwellia sp. KU-HH00111]
MWRILLLFMLIFLIEPSVQAQSIAKRLASIEVIEDKNIAIVQLNELLTEQSLNKAQRIQILILQSRAYISLSNFAKALQQVKQAKQLAKSENLYLQQAQVDKLMGIIFYYQGLFGQALVSYQNALAYFNKQPFTEEIAIKQANLLNNIALVQTAQGDAFAALKSYQELEPIYQRYGDEEDRVDVRYNLAVLYISLRRYDIAINLLQEVIARRIALRDEYGVARASGDLGVSYKHSGQYSKAKKRLLKALDYFKKHENYYDVASYTHNISEVHFELSELEPARTHALSCVKMSQKIGHKKAQGGCYHTLAKTYFYLGDIEHAQTHVELSDSIANEMGYQELISNNQALMSLIYAAKRQTAKALTSQLNYIKAKQQISNAMLNQQIAQFESAQLAQQVKNLQQNKKLQHLQTAKKEQLRWLVIVGVSLLLALIFSVYRRHLVSRLNIKLEARVKQRTLALEYLTKELKNANSIKSQFLANMSHEIRTPLTAVLGQAEAIIYGDLDDEAIVKEVKVIHANSLHLLQLINDILDLSKIEANKFELETRQQDLYQTVNQLNDMFMEQAQRKNLSFSITHHLPTPFIIDIDGLRLKQILINLCSNAIKFTSEGWVSLDIAIINKTLLFTVTDTGIGMTEEQIAKIFNIFTQGDNSISRRFSGSGLGLFLSEQLAKVMSGSIAVTSVLNQGSTFVLKLPFGEVYPMLADNEAVAPALPNKKKCYRGKILLADDHDDNRRLIARMLTGIGLEVIEASNGIEAVELCQAHQPNVALLDIQMPEMDGIEALEKLRELGCTLPIYALTANAMSHEIAQYLQLGFVGHLKKPIEREAFLGAISAHFLEVNLSTESKDTVEDDQALIDLKQSFVEKLSQDRQSIIFFNQQGDHNGLARTAHKISGAGQMFGFTELSQSAAALESAIKQQCFDNVDDLTHCLLDEINAAEYSGKTKVNLSQVI